MRAIGAAGLALVLTFYATRTPAQDVQTFGVYDLQEQRIAGPLAVAAPRGSHPDDVQVVVTVDTDGKVIDAKLAHPNRGSTHAAALEAAQQWRFAPQNFEGKPIIAVGTIKIDTEPAPIPPNTNIRFPDAKPEDVEITLERSACFGSCPDYRVTIHGDGRVIFSPRGDVPGDPVGMLHREFNGDNVIWPVRHEDRIEPKLVTDLLDKFRAAHFMGMKDEYVAEVTDSSTTVLTLRMGRTRKTVVDYVGTDVGMPESVRALQDAVDKTAGTERWIDGNVDTIAWMKARGVDFRSREAAAIILGAIARNHGPDGRARLDPLLRAAIDAGLDLDRDVPFRDRQPEREPESLGTAIAVHAAISGDAELFERLAKAGYVARMTQEQLEQALANAGGCDPAIIRALVAAGARASGESNPLFALQDDYGYCAKVAPEQRLAAARVLIELGTPVNDRNEYGKTPLMDSSEPEIAKLLIQSGADINARTDDGESVLLYASGDQVLYVLLRAGADAKVHTKTASVRDIAKRWHYPATLAWLDAHGIP